MKISVVVKPRSKIEGVEVSSEGHLMVRVSAPPAEGKANTRVLELLAEHFNCPKSSVRLVHGSKGKKKIFEVG